MKSTAERGGKARGTWVAATLLGWAWVAVGLTPAVEANEIRLGYAVADAGARGVPVLITASNEVPIHGYSVSFSFRVPELRLKSISLAGTHVGTLEPEFFAPRVDNELGLGSLGVILDFNLPIGGREMPATAGTPPIIGRLLFDVASTAQGGNYALQLTDGLGTPASYNRFTSAGESIAPTLASGSFVVRGGNRLFLDNAIAIAGAAPNVPIFVRTQHARPLQGFQVAFTYDKRAMTLNDKDVNDPEEEFIERFRGTNTLLDLGESRIESYTFEHDGNYSLERARVTAAVLFDFYAPLDETQVLAPSLADPPMQSILRYSFDVHASADDDEQYQELILENLEIPGSVDNRFIIERASVDPELINGRIYFSTGSLRGRLLNAETAEPVRGATVTTTPLNVTAATDINGVFILNDLPAGPYQLTFEEGAHYPTTLESAIVEGRFATSAVGDVLMYAIPETRSKPFLRGYINGDNSIDLSDGIGILNYLFLSGAEIGCQSAADVNDDNGLDLSDGVFLLNFLFLGGAAPAVPFNTRKEGCSDDPTPGGLLTCEEFEC